MVEIGEHGTWSEWHPRTLTKSKHAMKTSICAEPLETTISATISSLQKDLCGCSNGASIHNKEIESVTTRREEIRGYLFLTRQQWNMIYLKGDEFSHARREEKRGFLGPLYATSETTWRRCCSTWGLGKTRYMKVAQRGRKMGRWTLGRDCSGVGSL